MTTTDLMLLPATDPPGSIEVLHLEGGRWRPQAIPLTGVTPEQALLQVESMLQQVAKELDDPIPEGYLDIMQAKLNALFQAVVPKELGDKLAADAEQSPENDPPVIRLHLDKAIDRYPWELMFDGTGYLGLRNRIARLPLVKTGPRPADGVARPIRDVASLLGEHVLEEEAERTSWNETFKGVVNGKVKLVRRPEKEGAEDTWPTFTALKQEVDLLYLVCHGRRNTDGLVYWSLDDDRPAVLGVSVLADHAATLGLQKREPLVFANACHPLADETPPSVHDLATASFGWVFFEAGATAFVGTVAPISKRVALPFASAFFERLLAKGESVSAALHGTKRQFLASKSADPSYLFYSLYGDPDTVFKQAGGD